MPVHSCTGSPCRICTPRPGVALMQAEERIRAGLPVRVDPDGLVYGGEAQELGPILEACGLEEAIHPATSVTYTGEPFFDTPGGEVTHSNELPAPGLDFFAGVELGRLQGSSSAMAQRLAIQMANLRRLDEIRDLTMALAYQQLLGILEEAGEILKADPKGAMALLRGFAESLRPETTDIDISIPVAPPSAFGSILPLAAGEDVVFASPVQDQADEGA